MTELTDWQPKGAKTIKWVVTGLLGFAALGIIATIIKLVVPTIADAVALLNLLLSNFIYLSLTFMALLAVLWLGIETFSSNGRINKLFMQSYSSLMNKLSWELLNVDPLSPLYDKQRETREKKTTFDEAVARIHGVMGHWQNKEAQYRDEASKAERQAKAAEKLMATDPAKEPAFRKLAYEAGRKGEQADRYAKRRAGLAPVAANLVRVQGALDVLISNLDTDISIARDEWEAAQTMSSAERAARGVLTTSREELAQNAMALIQQRYGEAFGRLDHLSDLTKPMLDSIDLEQATYQEDLLAKWQTESQLLLEGPKQAPMQVLAAPVTDYDKLIR